MKLALLLVLVFALRALLSFAVVVVHSVPPARRAGALGALAAVLTAIAAVLTALAAFGT